MGRSLGVGIALATAALLAAAGRAEASGCKGGEVLVKDKTPIRRGPGLNYPVDSFLERGRCLSLTEISADKGWALVQAGATFGWVPVSRLDAAGQKRAAAMDAPPPPAGSGQSQLLALSMTPNEKWVEVRDDRNDTGWVRASALSDPGGALGLVPRTDAGVDAVAADPARVTDPSPDEGEPPPAPPSGGAIDPHSDRTIGAPQPVLGADDLAFGMRILVGASVPAMSLDSNGVAYYRRYDISALAGSARAEVRMAALGPLDARLAYGFTFVTGVSEATQPNNSIGATQHELRAVVGLPLVGGDFQLSPELGFYGALASVDRALLGAPAVQFVSSDFFGGSAGLSALWLVSGSMGLEAEAAFLLGPLSEGPIDLGSAGLAFGVAAGLGAIDAMSDSVDLLLRWDLRFRSAGFSGISLSDPSVTRATLSSLENGFSVGMGFRP
jgi:hypothetical protein